MGRQEPVGPDNKNASGFDRRRQKCYKCYKYYITFEKFRCAYIILYILLFILYYIIY